MPDATSTADQVRRAIRGEARAFDELARTFLRPAYAVALAVLGRPADAEDVAQEALVTALERIESCRDPERFGPWLLQSTRNRALNWLQHRKLADVPASVAAVMDEGHHGEVERGPLRRQLLAALEAVTALQREVVLLHDLEGWTHAEIAAALEISEVSSRQHLFNARRTLRTRLGDPTPTEERP
jgi:RNA polymerase sigma-70 factor (ECF subfamily)